MLIQPAYLRISDKYPLAILAERVALLEGKLDSHGPNPLQVSDSVAVQSLNELEHTAALEESKSSKQHESAVNTAIQHSEVDITTAARVDEHDGSRLIHQSWEQARSVCPSMATPEQEGPMLMRVAAEKVSPHTICGVLQSLDPLSALQAQHISRSQPEVPGKSSRARLRVRRAVRELAHDTRDYLLALFWEFYNSSIQIVHKDAFLQDLNCGRTQFYSDVLHLCMIAVGCRYADRKRPDIQRLFTSGRETPLHRDAKSALDCDAEEAPSIPGVLSLLLLSDLESAGM